MSSSKPTTDIESTINLLASYEDVISEAAREELESLRQNSPEESVHKTGADSKTSEFLLLKAREALFGGSAGPGKAALF